MIYFLIIISGLLTLALYSFISRKEHSFFNVFSPYLLLSFPANFVLEIFNLYTYDSSGSFIAYVYCYFLYIVSFGLTIVGYLLFPCKKIVGIPFGKSYTVNSIIAYLIIASSFLLYLPVLIQFKENLDNPRLIYVLTRTGYGVNFFLSTTLMYVGYILILFKKKLLKIELIFVSLYCFMLAYLHGSKVQIITIIIIFMLHRVYSKKIYTSLKNFLLYFLIFSSIILSLFMSTLYYSRTSDASPNAMELLTDISSYSDYTRNAIKVIDSDLPPQFGRLSFEEQIFSRIPRILFPDKPKDFGSFYLAKYFYPSWFNEDTGSPAFGLGVIYADFGFFSVVVECVKALFSGAILRLFVVRFKEYNNPSDFLMIVFASGVSIIPIGVGYLLPENLLIAIIISVLSRIRI